MTYIVHLCFTARKSTIVLVMAKGRIQQRIDSTLQKQAEAILEAQGIKPSLAIVMFYTEVKRHGGLPFKPTPVQPSEIPNKRLAKEIRKARKGIGVQRFENKEDFFASLKKQSRKRWVPKSLC